MVAASAIIVVLVVTAAFILDSGMVDLFAGKQLVQLFNKEYRGRLELKEVRLRFPDQVTIIAPGIFEEGAQKPVFTAESIRLNFNFLSLIRPKISLLSFREVDISGFRGAIVEYPDGKLNIENIFTKRRPDEPEKLSIDKFRARHIRISNASFSWKPVKKAPYALTNINLDLSRVFIAKREFIGTLKQMRFSMPDRGVTVTKGSGSLAFSSMRSDVIGLDIATEKSHAKLSVSMEGLNIFSGITRKSIAKSKTFVHVESLSIDTGDLNVLLPANGMPQGTYRFSGDAKGTLDDLVILPSVFEYADSRLAFRGELLDLLNPGDLSFNLKIDKSVLSASLLTNMIREERYRKLALDAKKIEFSGTLRGGLPRWKANLGFRSDIGAGSTIIETIRNGDGQYRAEGTFTLEKIELHRLLGMQNVRSGFNGSGSFNGTFGNGVVEKAHVETSVTSAFWQQQTLSSGSLTLDLAGKEAEFSVDLGSAEGAGIIMAGVVDFSQTVPSYEAGGRVMKLDLSKFTGSPDLTSDLNGSFEVKGQGAALSALNLKGNMELEPSLLNGFRFRERSSISATIAQSATGTLFTVASEAFDFSVQGSASLPQVIDAMQRASRCITGANLSRQSRPIRSASASYAFDYRLTIRDLTPLRPFLRTDTMQFRGDASGHAASSGGRLSIDTDIRCSTFSGGTTFSISNAVTKARLQCMTDEVLATSVTGSAETLTILGKEFRNLLLRSSFDKERLDTAIEMGSPRPDEKLDVAFHALRHDRMSTVTIDRFQFTTPRGVWQIASGNTLDIASDFMRFNRIRLDKGNQSLLMDGVLSSTVPGTFQCIFSNIDLGETQYFFPDPRLKQLRGQTDLRFTVSGSPGSKTSEIELDGSDIAYDELTIGTVRLSANHSGERLRFSVESQANQTAKGAAAGAMVNTITGSGSIPLQLNYSPFRVRLPENASLQAALYSDDLSARLIAYIVPIFDFAEGTMPTDIRITGTVANPDIFLTSNLDGTKVRIAPTQVTYQVNGRIVGTPSGIDLGRLEVSDSQGGTGAINGMISLEGLKPVSVNLSGIFRNLLLYSKKDMKDDTSFGTISATTDNIRFHGLLSAPVAEGELRLTSANFSLYRKGSNESAKYIGVEKFIRFVPRKPQAKPVETLSKQPEGYPQFHFNLLDILQIRNLRLSSNLPVRGAMIFDRIRGERIEATLNNLSLLVNKVERRYSLYGSVDLTGGKYVFSNSSFDLDSGGQITWNNEEIRSGRLNDIYGSKQVSAYDARSGDRDNVKLLIAVSGTIDRPDVRMGYYLNDDPQPYAAVNLIGKQSSHIDPNADLNVISMLFSRQWYLNPERQTTGNYNPVSGVGVSAGTGLLSSQVSSLVQDIAGIESFNVNLGTSANGNLSGLELYFALLVPGTDGKIRFIGTGSTPVSGSSTTSNYAYGSSQKIEYRVNPKVYVEAFRSYGMSGNDATYTSLQKPTENWGASISYREKFHTWSQFWDHLFRRKKDEKARNKTE